MTCETCLQPMDDEDYEPSFDMIGDPLPPMCERCEKLAVEARERRFMEAK